MKHKTHLVPYLLVLSTAFGWALSTIIIKVSIGTIPAFHLMAGRFLFASLLLIAANPKTLKRFTRKALGPSFILAVLLFLSYTFAIISLQYTSASKSGFLVALSVIFVPIIQSVIRRKAPTVWLVITIGLSVAGMWLISGMNGAGFNIGDFYAILCSVTYSGYIMAMNKITHDHPTYTLTVMQLLWVSLLSFVGIFFFETFTPQIFVTGLIPILTIGVVGTALSTLTQTYAQQKVSAEAVSIILLGEPLFTLLMAITILNEPTTLQGLTGAALLIVSMYTTVHKRL